MPITETPARLWFDTQDEINEYDDRMISNIELKSLDFDDENFSPVFNRATQEVFLQPSEKFKADFNKLTAPLKGAGFEELIDKYINFKPNHTYYRHWPIDKFIGGFGLSYLILREIPIRNFYARGLILYSFFAKFFDHFESPLPSFYPKMNLHVASDRWQLWDLRCYDIIWKATRFVEIPTNDNRVRESKIWYAKQPGHILRTDSLYAGHFLAGLFSGYEKTYWDGTMNQPLHRLADPMSKDSYMMHYT